MNEDLFSLLRDLRDSGAVVDVVTVTGTHRRVVVVLVSEGMVRLRGERIRDSRGKHFHQVDHVALRHVVAVIERRVYEGD